ncbi:hypothetical protein [Salinifilum ghardaiensis]
MTFDVFRDDFSDVFWIVGAGARIRHAMRTLPGAVFAGESVTTLCGSSVKVPMSTPAGRTPASAHVTDRCPPCAATAEAERLVGHVWDY